MTPRSAGPRARGHRRGSVLVTAVTVAALSACGTAGGPRDAGDPGDPVAVAGAPSAVSDPGAQAVTYRPPPKISLGAGLLAYPDAATAWVRTHRGDPRAAAISRALVGRPTALWLTGDESFGNLSDAVRRARAADRTMVLSLYNIPLRWDGLSDPSPISLSAYQQWIDRVVASVGRTRAVVVLEPDALWFYDRMPTDEDRVVRLQALRYAVDRFAASAPRTRVYLDAGTSSRSVTPERMAELLVAAGVRQAAGFAVNTSSYAPSASIQPYAQAVRTALRARGIADPRYVTDTGRNGASGWDYDWCNPQSQRLGRPPGALGSADGRDLNLWVKAPGTSDGDCGPAGGGRGTYGGEFIPALAYQMIGKTTAAR